MRRLLFSLLFLSTVLTASSQTDSAGLKISAKQLSGKWQSLDSSKYIIQFVENKIDLILKNNSLLDFYFQKDSLGFVPNRGVKIQWHPITAMCD